MYKKRNVSLIIPTRYGSERLNGKVLWDINGKKQIEIIIERALKSKYIDNVILAITAKKEENEKILEWYTEYRTRNKKPMPVYFYIGEHNNIIKRCLGAADKYMVDIIIDTSHDCTFFDPELADKLIERLFEYAADYSANCITRTYPDGFDIQVYTKKIYQKIYDSNEYYEFYSGWNIFYAREKIYPKPKIINMEAAPDCYYPHWHLCLDTKEDKILIEHIMEYFNNDLDISYREIIFYLENNQELLEINKSVIPTELKKELK
jgi:spore coat polysaccharide biosynthesis protein SpsF (cytidylyltransferase family)